MQTLKGCCRAEKARGGCEEEGGSASVDDRVLTQRSALQDFHDVRHMADSTLLGDILRDNDDRESDWREMIVHDLGHPTVQAAAKQGIKVKPTVTTMTRMAALLRSYL